jgi:hypothetical protein
MPLRNLNEPVTIFQVMTEIAAVAKPNTIVGSGGTVLVNTKELLYTANATWPAVVFWEAPQSTARIGWKLWQSKLTCVALYMGRYDQNTEDIDSIWATVDLDLRRMKANLEDNPRVYVGTTRYVADITLVTLSPFVGNVNQKEFMIPVVERQMSIQINLGPYASAG